MSSHPGRAALDHAQDSSLISILAHAAEAVSSIAAPSHAAEAVCTQQTVYRAQAADFIISTGRLALYAFHCSACEFT